MTLTPDDNPAQSTREQPGKGAALRKSDPKFSAAAVPVLDTPSSLEKSLRALSEKLDIRTARKWNTDNLAQRCAADAASAAAAGGLVAPVISMIDRAVMENTSGRKQMMESISGSLRKLLLQPHIYLTSRPFRLIFMVYGGTYFTANSLDTAKATIGDKPASTTSSGTAKFIATSAANLSLSMYKDSQFTKMFGAASSSSSRPVPPASFALFAVRDTLTIFASFNVPPLLAPVLPISEGIEKHMNRATAAQFIAPAAMQLLSTPLHLMGLDLYNRPADKGSVPLRWVDRLHKVRVDWLSSSAARMCRIVPAFGFGGVINTGVRSRLMKGIAA